MKSLYIHIPFCEKKCFYCSFVVSVGHDKAINPYLNMLDEEMRLYQGEIIKTIYLGGGTPSYLSLEQLRILFQNIKNNFELKNLKEWTIEINPEGINDEKIKLIFDSGVNRISMGVQTLNNHYLKYLGRNHDVKKALETYQMLRKVGFLNINLDLMYSFPNQTDEEIKQDVQGITSLRSEHLSLYTLTIEENSRFYSQKVSLSDAQTRSRQYQLVINLLEESGFKQYEVSNFSKEGKESLHNMNYWKGGEYIGLGVGAHSYLNCERFWNTDQTQLYISQGGQKKNIVAGREKLSLKDSFMEILLLGLRMNEGCHVKELSKQMNFTLPSEKMDQINYFAEAGFLVWKNEYLQVTPTGRLVLDEISTRLI